MVILNFANPDMVGHTGVVEAAVKACQTIDADVKAIAGETLRLGGKLLITADHGNCEFMRNADGSPHTAHTTNLVHIFYVAADADNYTVNDGILADVAPTMLQMLGVAQPPQMTGKSLLVAKGAAPVKVPAKKAAAKKAAAKAEPKKPAAAPAPNLLEAKKHSALKKSLRLKKWKR
ncbi:MAG: hypothetical protein EOP85_05530, partial [Verrucomicrobiaceae bacterium]